MVRIEICGGIAAGKTTLATALTEVGFEAVFENFQVNPFWKKFYADPNRYAFETEISFLLHHYHEIKTRLAMTSHVIACDYSFALDRAYADVTLKKSELGAFLAVYKEVITMLPSTNLLIYLQCSPETELSRIRRRARDPEQSITIDYLTKLHNVLSKYTEIFAHDIPVITINSEQNDFAYDKTTRSKIVAKIKRKIVDLLSTDKL